MKHWAIECNHNCPNDVHAASGRSSNKWCNVGPIDPIKAILITNG